MHTISVIPDIVVGTGTNVTIITIALTNAAFVSDTAIRIDNAAIRITKRIVEYDISATGATAHIFIRSPGKAIQSHLNHRDYYCQTIK